MACILDLLMVDFLAADRRLFFSKSHHFSSCDRHHKQL
jgi:hypothetical protein